MINVDTIREAFDKWLLELPTPVEFELFSEYPELSIFHAGYLSALATIDSTSDDKAVAKTLQYLNAEMDKKDAEIQRLTAHDDAIRRECAMNAERWFYNTISSSATIELEHYLAELRLRQITTLKVAIMGKD